MNLYCITFGLIFLVAGIAFFMGVGPNWIKEWREMSQKEKSKIRIRELSKNIGCVFMAASGIFLISGVNAAFMEAAFTWCMVAWFILTGIDVVYIAKSNRYKFEQ